MPVRAPVGKCASTIPCLSERVRRLCAGEGFVCSQESQEKQAPPGVWRTLAASWGLKPHFSLKKMMQMNYYSVNI